MSIHNKKTARLLQGVALGLIIISATLLLGCETPVGGIEQKPIEELVGKVYKSRWNELFYISSADTIEIGYQYEDEEKNIKKVFESKGKIIDRTTTEKGTVYLLKSIEHSNTIPSQYPNYNDKAPHSDCYFLIYVRSCSATSLEWAQFSTVTGKERELTDEQIKQGLKAVTACFAVDSVDKAQEYLNLDNWTSIYISTGIAQN